MKKVVILIISLILMVGCSDNETTKIGYKTITTKEAYDIMNTSVDITIIDVRTNSEYESGHIKNAINIPLDEIENSIDAFVSDKERTILVYCKSGSRSELASEKLLSLGYTNVYNFGGINNWPYEIVIKE